MKAHFCALAAVLSLALPGCGKKEEAKKPTAPEAASPSASGNPLTAPVDYLGAAARAKKTAGAVVDMASVNRAVQMFQAGEDRNPSNLNELVTKGYLPKLPVPPKGMKLTYDPRTGQARVTR